MSVMTIPITSIPTESELLAHLPTWLAAVLPEYLPTVRWYGDKAKVISSVSVDHVIPVNGIGHPAALAVATIQFHTQDSSTYLMPVLQSLDRDPMVAPILELTSESGSVFLVDGLGNERFRGWFADAIAGLVHNDGVSADRLDAQLADLNAARVLPNRLLGVDQSNTSIAFGFDMLIKVLRRLQPGTHPDVELTRFLTARSDFDQVPPYFGSLNISTMSGESSVIAFAQKFVESVGDGWTFLLGLLREHVRSGQSKELQASSETIARQLGEVTGRMHLALGSDPWTRDMAPEQIKRDDTERWSAGYIALIDRVSAELSDNHHRFDQSTSDLVETFLQLSPGLKRREAGFERLVGRSKTRVHGDYHLGQTMRTIDGDFVVIDFEGEPLRSIEERRQKTSPLKDVAGMLRSFSYARGTATAWITEGTGLLASDLVQWERLMRREFLAAYISTVTTGGGAFLPSATGDVQAALAAWELDKAAYEVIYELNNRPDWLWIPLSSMLKQAEPEQPELVF